MNFLWSLKWVSHKPIVKWKVGCILFGSTGLDCNTHAKGTLFLKTIASGATKRCPFLRKRYSFFLPVSFCFFFSFFFFYNDINGILILFCQNFWTHFVDIHCDFVSSFFFLISFSIYIYFFSVFLMRSMNWVIHIHVWALLSKDM